MMKKHYCLLIFSFLFLHMQGWAWGYKGHKIVAELARSFIAKNIADSVQFYLGETSFESASVWMDDARSDHAYDYLKPMHYINIEKDKTYVKTSDPNILNELDAVFEGLQNRKGQSRENTKFNLLILFHLAGDLHQPLHAGYADDKGGNAVEIEFQGANTNLHRLWDTQLIESQNISFDECHNVARNLPDKERRKIAEINFVSWMNESRQLLPEVYALTNNVADKAYTDKNAALIRTQLIKAGIRLASVLTEVFHKTSKHKQNGASSQHSAN